MDIISSYISFKEKNFIKLISKIDSDFITDDSVDVLKKYIDTYIQTYYFHSLQTLDYEDCSDYGLNTIGKEFDGKRLEIIFELENKTEEMENIINRAYNLVLFCAKLDLAHEDLIPNIIQIFSSKFKMDCTEDVISSFIKKMKTKEQKFINSLEFDNFNLMCTLYKEQNNKFYSQLAYDIKQLGIYSELSINKNYNKEELAYDKLKTTMGMIGSFLLKKIINSESVGYYFVDLPTCLLDDERLDNIFDMMTNPYIREHIVFVVNFNGYVNHKRILNYFDVNYSFAALVDMSHINDVENKIENVENIKMFDYVILDKVKEKDYELILKYDSLTGKNIFINELVKE